MLKQLQIDGLEQPIVLARRKGTRSIKLSIKSDGTVRLTVPYGVPEFAAKKFAQSKLDWIAEHQKPQNIIKEGTRIGKAHHLYITRTSAGRSSTKITMTDTVVHIPESWDITSAKAQEVIKKACEKTLAQEAASLLPQRLDQLAKFKKIAHGTTNIKKMKSRWGMCDRQGNITLNSHLMQLDWILIDYVIYHELAHTIHHHHQASFWELVSQLDPQFKEHRRELKTKSMIIST